MAIILNIIVYVLFIIRIRKLEKQVDYFRGLLFERNMEELDEEFWSEENETEKI